LKTLAFGKSKLVTVIPKHRLCQNCGVSLWFCQTHCKS